MRAALGLFLVVAGCASSSLGGTYEIPPWGRPAVPADSVATVFLDVWRAAENRATCRLLAPQSVEPSTARPRAATFSGGWGVAFDLPDTRSAFGVAGTGATVGGVTYAWPNEIEWVDGSRAGYGPEGGTGPNQLAYLEIPGQRCLYNVWSRLGTQHLESLLRSLRFVEVEGPGA